jgi:hypothetical protein
MWHLSPSWIFVPTAGLRVADQMQMQLALTQPSLHLLQLQPSLVIHSSFFSVTINEINVTVQRASKEPSHAFALERREVSGSGPSEDRLLSLLRRLSGAEAMADLQQRLQQHSKQRLDQVL